MKKRAILLLPPLAALVLEALPWGVVLNFANPEGPPFRYTYAYFSLTPFGYANFAPLLVAILTCVIVALTLVFLLRPRAGVYQVTRIFSVLDFVLSLAPALFGALSAIGVMISAVLLLHIGLLFFGKRWFL